MWLHEQTSCQWVLHQWFQWWSAKRQSLTQAASSLRTVRSAIHLCSGWRHCGWRVLCYWRLATTSLTKMTESVWHAALSAPTAAAAVSWALSVTARCEALILHRHKELTVWSRDLREETGGYPHRDRIEAWGWGQGTDDHGNQRQVKTKARRYFSGVGYQLLDVWVKCFVGEENAQQRSTNVRRAGIIKAQMGWNNSLHIILIYWLWSESNSKGKWLFLEFIKGFVSVLPTLTDSMCIISVSWYFLLFFK